MTRLATTICLSLVAALAGAKRNLPFLSWRGGASRQKDNSYVELAEAIQPRLDDAPEISKIVKALKSLSAAQKAFKGLDGAAHEAYQRTHNDEIELSVRGRATRSRNRLAATADGLGACELCELVSTDSTTLKVLVNKTATELGSGTVRVLVLYEPDYRGPAGEHHGEFDDEGSQRSTTVGRLLVAVADETPLDETLGVLETAPRHVRVGEEVASVQPTLHSVAAALVSDIEEVVRAHNTSAVHLVGHGLSGAVAAIVAAVLQGDLPLPKRKKRSGLARGRTSAVTLGAPPCFSANVAAPYITSVRFDVGQ